MSHIRVQLKPGWKVTIWVSQKSIDLLKKTNALLFAEETDHMLTERYLPIKMHPNM